MICSSTTCADHRFAKPFHGAIVALLIAASGCSVVAPDIEKRAQLPASTSVDPNPSGNPSGDPRANPSLGTTASAPPLHQESEQEAQTDTTPIDRP
jgi:hypothetical protein